MRGQVEKEIGRCKSNQKEGILGQDKGIREKYHQGFGKWRRNQNKHQGSQGYGKIYIYFKKNMT